MNHIRLAAPAGPAAFNDDFQGITMKKETPQRLCRDCRHHIPYSGNESILLCAHPKVNARDPLVLAAAKPGGIQALDERRKTWTLFGRVQCGMRGALWEPKDRRLLPPPRRL